MRKDEAAWPVSYRVDVYLPSLPRRLWFACQHHDK